MTIFDVAFVALPYAPDTFETEDIYQTFLEFEVLGIEKVEPRVRRSYVWSLQHKSSPFYTAGNSAPFAETLRDAAPRKQTR